MTELSSSSNNVFLYCGMMKLTTLYCCTICVYVYFCVLITGFVQRCRNRPSASANPYFHHIHRLWNLCYLPLCHITDISLL